MTTQGEVQNTPQPLEITRTTAPSSAGSDSAPAASPPEASTQPNSPEPEAPRAKKVERGEIIVGAKPHEQISFSKKELTGIVGLLSQRRHIVEEFFTTKPGHELTTVERFVQRLTDADLSAIENGTITREHMAIIWFTLHDELILKSADIGTYLQDKPVGPGRLGRLGRMIPFFEKVKTKTQPGFPQQSSDLSELSGDKRNIEQQIKNLSHLRLKIEVSLYGKAFGSGLFDEEYTSIHPLNLNRRSENLIRGIFREQLKETMAQKYPNQDYEAIVRENPALARQILFEANNRALARYAERKAQEFLTDSRPEVDTAAIKTHKDNLTQPPTTENIIGLTADLATKNKQFQEAEARFKDINDPLETAKNDLDQSLLAAEKAQRHYDTAFEKNNSEIQRLQDRAGGLASKTQAASSRLNAAQQTASQQALAETATGIAGIEKLIKEYKDELNRLLIESADAETDFYQKQTRYDAENEAANEKGLEDARTNLAAQKEARDKAETALKEAQESKDPTKQKENQQKAAAFDVWLKASSVDGYAKIINTRFERTILQAENEFSTAMLSDPAKGAEQLRRHLFYVLDKAKYDPQLAGKMVNDAVIKAAISRTLRLKDQGIDVNTLSTAQTLAYLKNTNEFQVGDMLRFIIHQGVRQAENGNPYLSPEDFPIPGQPTLRSPEGARTPPSADAAEALRRIGALEERMTALEGKVANLPTKQDLQEMLDKIKGSTSPDTGAPPGAIRPESPGHEPPAPAGHTPEQDGGPRPTPETTTVNALAERVGRIEETMVTKDYLEEKLQKMLDDIKGLMPPSNGAPESTASGDQPPGGQPPEPPKGPDGDEAQIATLPKEELPETSEEERNKRIRDLLLAELAKQAGTRPGTPTLPPPPAPVTPLVPQEGGLAPEATITTGAPLEGQEVGTGQGQADTAGWEEHARAVLETARTQKGDEQKAALKELDNYLEGLKKQGRTLTPEQERLQQEIIRERFRQSTEPNPSYPPHSFASTIVPEDSAESQPAILSKPSPFPSPTGQPPPPTPVVTPTGEILPAETGETGEVVPSEDSAESTVAAETPEKETTPAIAAQMFSRGEINRFMELRRKKDNGRLKKPNEQKELQTYWDRFNNLSKTNRERVVSIIFPPRYAAPATGEAKKGRPTIFKNPFRRRQPNLAAPSEQELSQATAATGRIPPTGAVPPTETVGGGAGITTTEATPTLPPPPAPVTPLVPQEGGLAPEATITTGAPLEGQEVGTGQGQADTAGWEEHARAVLETARTQKGDEQKAALKELDNYLEGLKKQGRTLTPEQERLQQEIIDQRWEQYKTG